jgi:hypothetical protein
VRDVNAEGVEERLRTEERAREGERRWRRRWDVRTKR